MINELNTVADRVVYSKWGTPLLVLESLLLIAIVSLMTYIALNTHSTPRIIPTELPQVREDFGYTVVPRSNTANPNPTPRTYKTDAENAAK
jgi:hypothetical protein